jgi:hypothetical protein
MRTALFRILSGAFVISLLSGGARADNIYGTIRGTVTDASGAVMAGVKITATNTATGVSYIATSESTGGYQFLLLPAPGIYNVRAEQTGFRTFEGSGIPLQLNQNYALDIRLAVGALRQNLTVEASPAQVETTSMQLSAHINSTAVEQLPLNGRNWIQLQQTLPGVVASSDRLGTNYSTNGARTQANSYLVNGTDANDLQLNTPLQIPSPDAIAEVNIVTNTINPEYGRNSGAVLNAVTKSGTNAFHGDAFEFYRDNALNTPNFFSNGQNTIFHQNQFGGTLGGPIKKDKTFFFGSYQGTRRRTPDENGGGDTPVFTEVQRNGEFPDIATSSNLSAMPLVGDNGQTYLTGTPYSTIFPQGTIPAADFDSVCVGLMNKYVPLPNSPDGKEYLFSPISTASINQEIFRIDENLKSSDSLFAYGFISREPEMDDLPLGGATLPGFAEKGQENIYQYTLAWNHTFGGTSLNEARFGYNRLNFNAVYPVNPVLPSSVGFTGITPQNTQAAGVPVLSLTGYFTLGFSSSGPQPRIDQTYQVTDNFSKIVGNHTFKMGFEMRRAQVYNPFYFLNNGFFSFGAGAGTNSTGDAGADFLLGVPVAYEQSSGGVINARAREYYSYFQDQWKITRKLVLTYGTGWQIDTPLTNIYNDNVALICFRPGEQSNVYPTAPQGMVYPGDPGCTASGYHTQWDHFGPRVGFAYSLGSSGKTSIRGGVGIYYNVPEEELTLQNLETPPLSIMNEGVAAQGAVPSLANPFVSVDGSVTTHNPFPFTPPAKGSSIDYSQFEPMSLNVISPNFTIARSYNYNLTVERQLPASMILSASYVGLQGRHLENTLELNPAGAFPGVNPSCVATPGCNAFNSFITDPTSYQYDPAIFGSLGQQSTDANSNYNSLQISVNKRFTNGLQFQASYGWSHSLDFGSSLEDSFGLQNPFARYLSYGDSRYDARDRFVFSYVYNLPDFRHNQDLLSLLTNGWQIAGITTLQSGFPITLSDSSFNSDTCNASFTFYGCWDRPNVVGPVQIGNPRTNTQTYTYGVANLGGSPSLPNYWFNPNSFAVETPGAVGDAGRNFFHAPGINNFDFSLIKHIHIDEARYFELRFEFFNFFNHADFASPDANAFDPNFGRITSLLGVGASQYPAASRIVQLGAKFFF